MVIAGALLLVVVAVFAVLHPVITGREAPVRSTGEEVSEAEFRKRAVLLQLRDLEHEFAMGKLAEEDYKAVKGQLAREALAAIRAVKGEEEGAAEDAPSTQAAAEAELEEEIARARARLKGATFCSECGQPNPPGSRFCAECGIPLRTPQTSGTS
jgi:cytochrome c-type biogenesis protein CcmI